MQNLFISVSSPEESRAVSQKLDSLGYNKYGSFSETEGYIKVYEEDKDYTSFDDSVWGGETCEKMTAAEFLNRGRGLPECFYINVPTESLAQAVREKLKSLGYVDCYSRSKSGRVFSFKDKSFCMDSKDYPCSIKEEVSLDFLFSQPEPPAETEIPGVLTGDYTLFKKENGDFSIRECGKEILTVSAGNMAKIKEEVEKWNDPSATPFSIHVPTPELSEIAQKRLFELGFVNFRLEKTIERTDRPYINVRQGDVNQKHIRRNDYAEFPEIPISDLWKKRESVVLPGLVPGYDVIIGENGVKVGCQTISFESMKLL